jgi:hypothetical protein
MPHISSISWSCKRIPNLMKFPRMLQLEGNEEGKEYLNSLAVLEKLDNYAESREQITNPTNVHNF